MKLEKIEIKTAIVIAAIFTVAALGPAFAAKPLEDSQGAGLTPDRLIPYKHVKGEDGQPDVLNLHVFNPAGFDAMKPCPAIVFFFGGGWNGGTPDQFYPQAKYFASRGIFGICAEYRTKTSHGVHPSKCVEDGKSAVRYLRANAGQLSILPEFIAAGGGSAGGHVAAAAGIVTAFDATEEEIGISSIPNALVLFNPVYDNGPEGYGHDRVKDVYPAISPIDNIRKGLPPSIVFLGDQDKLIPVATAERFKKLMQDKGIRSELYVYPKQPHGFFQWHKDKTPDKSIFTSTVGRADRFLAKLGFLKGQPKVKAWSRGK